VTAARAQSLRRTMWSLPPRVNSQSPKACEVARALADAEPRIFWSDRADAPPPAPRLDGTEDCDLVIVGGGFTGLWAAIQAKEQDPARDVVVLEAQTVGFGASGRNGGFVDSSLTHGLRNGVRHFGQETRALQRVGLENLDAMAAALHRYHIDADWDPRGILYVATQPHQLNELRDEAALLTAHGEAAAMLDAAQTRAELDSPTFVGGCRRGTGKATVNPISLAWGLRRAAEQLGTRIYEQSPALRLRAGRATVTVLSPHGSVRAARAIIGTSAYPPPLRAIRRYVAPVYDYVLVTEPLTDAQLSSLGWRNRLPVADSGNQFHYYRLTPDNRILWGGYDAIYYYRGGVGPHHDQRHATFAKLAGHFLDTFPQLEGIRFTHRWGGAIDTCSRFCVTFGTAFGGRAAYAVGYTGLGVAATRFGARVALDLVAGRSTAFTQLPIVRKKAIPFPPEPVRWAGIQATRYALARSDRRDGQRGAWLSILDRAGVGFDSLNLSRGGPSGGS
jgi:glycine/D-amino acid oxidase-like deaminating enzyme